MKKLLSLFLTLMLVFQMTACTQPAKDVEAEKTPANEISQAEKEDEKKAEEISVDVAVVGAGTSGTTAGLAAAQSGAKTVIIEKTGVTGGMGIMSVGILATDTKQQEERGHVVKTEDIANRLREYTHNSSSGPLTLAILRKSADTIEWLQNNGLDLQLSPGTDQGYHKENPRTYHRMTGVSNENYFEEQFGSDNVATDNLFSGLYNEYAKAGGEILLKTRAYKLLIENGDVKGVICEKEDGSDLIVRAKSVILAAGGYGGNSEGFKERLGIDNFNVMSTPNDGEGIEMAVEAGAQEWGTYSLMLHNCDMVNPDGSKTTMNETDLKYIHQGGFNLWVNQEGTRFVNETVADDSALWSNSAYSQGGVYYVLFDQNQVEDMIANGTPTEMYYPGSASNIDGLEGFAEVDYSNPPVTMSGTKSGPIPELQNVIDNAVSKGEMIKANSSEELAKTLKMNAKDLNASFTSYNEAVANKNDKDYQKNPKFLVYPVSEGPYYAIRVHMTTLGGTLGGVRVNQRCEVLSAETGLSIPNLYAAGTNAGGYYGAVGYYPTYEGAAMSFAVNSGRIAGENAADSVK